MVDHTIKQTVHSSPIYVAKTSLPKIENYINYLQDIWETRQVTNNGKYTQELEGKLKNYLGVPHLQYVTNGTIALQIAINILELKGEIITTPFTYIATSTSIVWQNCKPVFVDIKPDTLTIDTSLIEDKITDQTTAILATHTFGFPCDVSGIDHIASEHDLKVIYDASHCFGIKYGEESLLNHGDLSTMSFHATKVFHTIEGGAVVTKNKGLNSKAFLAKSFGHKSEEYSQIGINGKNSEFHAAIGLCNLELIDEVIAKRKNIHELFCANFEPYPFEVYDGIYPGLEYNYAYLPLLFKNEAELLKFLIFMEQKNIFPRRYFYPSLNSLDYLNPSECEISVDISKRIVCMPVYHELSESDISRILEAIKTFYR